MAFIVQKELLEQEKKFKAKESQVTKEPKAKKKMFARWLKIGHKKSHKTGVEREESRNESKETKMPQPEKKKKIPSSRSLKMRIFFKYALWAMLIWIFARGVYSFFDHTSSVQTSVYGSQVTAPIESDATKSFAVSFAKQYLTYDMHNNQDERANRLAPYIPATNDKNFGLEVTSGQTISQSAVEAWPWKVEGVDASHAIITVRTLVKTDKSSTTYYLAVPVAVSNNEDYQVYDYPAIVSGGQSVAASQKQELDCKQQLPVDEQNKIQEMLRGFFPVYVKGTPSEISYFFLSGVKPTAGLNGSLNFKELKDTKVVLTNTGATKAESTLVLMDQQSGAVYSFRYELDLAKQDGKWYVRQMKP